MKSLGLTIAAIASLFILNACGPKTPEDILMDHSKAVTALIEANSGDCQDLAFQIDNYASGNEQSIMGAAREVAAGKRRDLAILSLKKYTDVVQDAYMRSKCMGNKRVSDSIFGYYDVVTAPLGEGQELSPFNPVRHLVD